MPPDENLPRLAPASVFVGRERELQLVDDALARAAQGNGQVVVVCGEAGIGKTRLLEELAAHARRHGTLVLWGSCEEGAAGNAYGPFREALDAYVGEVAEATLCTQLGARAGVIAPLVPRGVGGRPAPRYCSCLGISRPGVSACSHLSLRPDPARPIRWTLD